MIFITESGKEIQVPSDYTFQSLEKFAKEIYQQGRADERKSILGMVDFKQSKDYRTRSLDMRIKFSEMLEPEQVIKIILEQLKEQEE